MIKLTNEIALITAVSDLRMFLDIVNDVTFEFPRIKFLSDGEKSPSGPIKTEIGLPCFKVSTFKVCEVFTSANNLMKSIIYYI